MRSIRRTLAIVPLLASSPALAADELLVTGWSSSNVVSYDGGNGSFNGVLIPGGSGSLSLAHSVRVGPGGDLFVSSFGNDRVLRYDPDGNPIGVFADVGAAGADGPTDALFGPDGLLYVGGLNSGGVFRFDGTTGAVVDTFVVPGQNNLNATEMMEFDDAGNLYVCSPSTNNVKVFASDGTFVRNYGRAADGLNDPHHLVLRPNGNLLIGSFGSGQILEYDPDNNFIGAFASGIASPHGLAWNDDRLYVTSFSAANVLEYSSDGTPLGVFAPGVASLSGATHLLFRTDPTDVPQVARDPVPPPGVHGAWPNPSRGAQTLSFALGANRRAGVVEILDLAGRRIRSLAVSDHHGEVRWDGRDARGRAVPAGVYFVRLEGAEGAARRLVRIR